MLILEILYLFSAALLAVYGFNSLALTLLYHRIVTSLPKQTNRAANSGGSYSTLRAAALARTSNVPRVTVQLPVFNERYVVRRLIEAAINLDWPAEQLQIQILDDSTDDTGQIIAAALAHHRARGAQMEIDHIRRANREHFKAGALQRGLASATGEFIAIFDADFVLPPDFLQKTIPCFDEIRVGCVQTRWGHVNPASSKLTEAQALGIDGHFMIEQAVRHHLNAFLNFNGTAGVWRCACINDAGGWQGDTLTEDLDLSYRAQLRGWRIVFQAQVIVPAELPVQLEAFKRQQFRWAKGSIQTALKLLGPLWRSSQPLWRKLLGTLHLTNYAVHPLMLLNLILTLPIILSNSPMLHFTPLFALSAIGPPLMYWMVGQVQSLSLPVRLYRLAVLTALGTGLSLSNTRAVLEAILGFQSEFKRTPKFASSNHSAAWYSTAYALPRSLMIWTELALALYALGLLSWSIGQGIWGLVFWLLLYAGGYSYLTCLSFGQARQIGAGQSTGDLSHS